MGDWVLGEFRPLISSTGPFSLTKSQAGSEEVAVFRIFQRSIPDAPNSRAKAVFGRCTLPGRIFVEAATLQEARRVILGIPELNVSQITAVERELWMRLLQPQGSTVCP